MKFDIMPIMRKVVCNEVGQIDVQSIFFCPKIRKQCDTQIPVTAAPVRSNFTRKAARPRNLPSTWNARNGQSRTGWKVEKNSVFGSGTVAFATHGIRKSDVSDACNTAQIKARPCQRDGTKIQWSKTSDRFKRERYDCNRSKTRSTPTAWLIGSK